MRRLARRLFTLCSAVSLLLWVLVCLLWVRSAKCSDTFSAFVPSETYLSATSRAGMLIFTSVRTRYPYDEPPTTASEG